MFPLSVPYRHDQPPRPLPVLRAGRRLSWVRVRQIGLDSNGNDARGHYYGRGEELAPYLIEYADGSSAAFWGPASRDDLRRWLKARFPKAKIERAPYIDLDFGPNIDHAHEQPIDFNVKPEAPKANKVQDGPEPLRISRGEKWKSIRAKRTPKSPDARAYSHKLQARLNQLARDFDPRDDDET